MAIHIQRREFITLLGGAVAAWPLAAPAQQGDQMRRIGVLMNRAADNPEGQARLAAFQQGLQQLGWSDGRNVRIDIRWGEDDVERERSGAVELLALAPDVIFASGTLSVAAVQHTGNRLPVVFVAVTDPVGAGLVDSLARPGGNITGFMIYEYSFGGKRLELLKQIAPNVTRVTVLRDPANPAANAEFAAIQALGQSLGVEVSPINSHGDPGQVERAITTFANAPNGGIILTPGAMASVQRDAIIALTARSKLPTVYPFRYMVTAGGLASIGPDVVEQCRLAASYVDRVLKGEKPADLPVQAPIKFEMVINLKTAKTLGIDVPLSLLARADEVIE
jgi:putative tryptophan/tyrosine transport system substrate-binding protein